MNKENLLEHCLVLQFEMHELLAELDKLTQKQDEDFTRNLQLKSRYKEKCDKLKWDDCQFNFQALTEKTAFGNFSFQRIFSETLASREYFRKLYLPENIFGNFSFRSQNFLDLRGSLGIKYSSLTFLDCTRLNVSRAFLTYHLMSMIKDKTNYSFWDVSVLETSRQSSVSWRVRRSPLWSTKWPHSTWNWAIRPAFAPQ